MRRILRLMTNPIDIDRLFARASELRHTIAFAIERLILPGLTTLRRALGRLESDVRFWLLWIYFSAPEGTYYVAPKATLGPPPTKTGTTPPVLKLAPQQRAFVLLISNSNPFAPDRTASSRPFKPRPSREDHLDNFAARMTALIGVISNPDSALKRIARKLARQPLITVVSRTLVEGAPAQSLAAKGDSQTLPAPKPHKRE